MHYNGPPNYGDWERMPRVDVLDQAEEAERIADALQSAVSLPDLLAAQSQLIELREQVGSDHHDSIDEVLGMMEEGTCQCEVARVVRRIGEMLDEGAYR